MLYNTALRLLVGLEAGGTDWFTGVCSTGWQCLRAAQRCAEGVLHTAAVHHACQQAHPQLWRRTESRAPQAWQRQLEAELMMQNCFLFLFLTEFWRSLNCFYQTM